MKKSLKILSFSAIALLVIIIILAGALFIPRLGSKPINIWSAGDKFNIENVKSIEKNPEEDFKILLFADIQLWVHLSDNKKTYNTMDELVQRVKPNLIITLGDNVSGVTTDTLIKSFIKKMDSYKIPWAPVFGNHEKDGNATLEWMADRFEDSYNKNKLCLFERGPSNLYGVGNYAINIKENNKIIQTLFMFDNGRYIKYSKNSKAEVYMGYEQIAWYEWMVNGIAESQNTIVESMTFSHFAMPEFREAIENKCVEDSEGFYQVPAELGFGYCDYLPGVAPVNSGFIDKAKPLGLKYVFSGHDHENTASIMYEGVRYTYGLKTGVSPVLWNNAKQYGGTVVTISDNNKVSIHNEVTEIVNK